MARAPDRIVLVGWGAIGQAVAGFLARRGCPARILAIGVRDGEAPREGLPEGASLLDDPVALMELGADLVVEAAGRDSVETWGRAALSAGIDFAVSSTSAFAEPALLEDLTRLAHKTGAQIVIPPGALGGVDALSAASRMGLNSVRHRIVKPPRAWRGTPAEDLCDLDTLSEARTFFTGTATDAAHRFPQNANVALITALSGLGPEQTKIDLAADPAAAVNRHEISADGGFGTLKIRLDNAPLPENPKSSAMTALNLVRLIENRCAPLVI